MPSCVCGRPTNAIMAAHRGRMEWVCHCCYPAHDCHGSRPAIDQCDARALPGYSIAPGRDAVRTFGHATQCSPVSTWPFCSNSKPPLERDTAALPPMSLTSPAPRTQGTSVQIADLGQLPSAQCLRSTLMVAFERSGSAPNIIMEVGWSCRIDERRSRRSLKRDHPARCGSGAQG